MLSDFYSRIIRFLIKKNILGDRFLNYTSSGINYDLNQDRVYQNVDDEKVYISRSYHGVPNFKGQDLVEWLNRDVYFKKYLPSGNDVYVDIGCGYGHELIYIAKRSPDVKILGIEANQEVITYCSANTSKFNNITLANKMIGQETSYTIPFSADYAGKGLNDEGQLEVEGQSFDEILLSHNIEIIDLLKLNVEGGEKEIIENLPFEKVKRLVISCHDFRYERGEDSFYRTYDAVCERLRYEDYIIEKVNPDYIPNSSWEKSLNYWIFAEKQ